MAGAGFALFIVAALAFAIFEPIQVLPRLRLAPGFALTAADGSSVTSDDGRGAVTLYTFAPTNCAERCEEIDRTMAEIGRRVEAGIDLSGAEFRLVTVALDSVEDPRALRSAELRSGADGVQWQWLGGDAEVIDVIVGAGFRQYVEYGEEGEIDFDPSFVLVDGLGVVRGDYRYRTLSDDTDKIVSHIEILGEELRYSNGAGAVAYEAAHLFLCYP